MEIKFYEESWLVSRELRYIFTYCPASRILWKAVKIRTTRIILKLTGFLNCFDLSLSFNFYFIWRSFRHPQTKRASHEQVEGISYHTACLLWFYDLLGAAAWFVVVVSLSFFWKALCKLSVTTSQKLTVKIWLFMHSLTQWSALKSRLKLCSNTLFVFFMSVNDSTQGPGSWLHCWIFRNVH